MRLKILSGDFTASEKIELITEVKNWIDNPDINFMFCPLCRKYDSRAGQKGVICLSACPAAKDILIKKLKITEGSTYSNGSASMNATVCGMFRARMKNGQTAAAIEFLNEVLSYLTQEYAG